LKANNKKNQKEEYIKVMMGVCRFDFKDFD